MVEYMSRYGKQIDDLLEAKDFAGAIVELVRARDWVTFIEVNQLLEGHMEVRGRFCLEPQLNLVVWGGMSEEYCDLISDILRTKRLALAPTSWLCYLIDGGGLKYPLAKRPPKNGYKNPHWAPVCLRLPEEQRSSV